jgi:guanylate kinase
MIVAPLIILSGPAGVGKSTVAARLVAGGEPPLHASVSATTRPARPGEVDGVHYHFWTRFRQQGVGVVLVIDVQGAAQVRARCPDAVSIFLLPLSIQVLEERMRKRRQDSEAVIQRRLEGARREIARAGEYTYQVVSDDLERTVAEVRDLIRRHFGEANDA